MLYGDGMIKNPLSSICAKCRHCVYPLDKINRGVFLNGKMKYKLKFQDVFFIRLPSMPDNLDLIKNHLCLHGTFQTDIAEDEKISYNKRKKLSIQLWEMIKAGQLSFYVDDQCPCYAEHFFCKINSGVENYEVGRK